MADLPIAEDNGQLPVTINDPTTVTNSTKVDSLGNLYTAAAPLDGFKATYSASVLGLVTATAATDIFTISGSGTKTIRVVRLVISAVETTAAIRDVQVIKRSAANTGGTSSAATMVPRDSNDAAATATVLSYTANPTSLGAAVGTVAVRKVNIGATNLTSAADNWNLDFTEGPLKAIVLRGTAQLLCVNLNAVTNSNSSYDIYVEWTEE